MVNAPQMPPAYTEQAREIDRLSSRLRAQAREGNWDAVRVLDGELRVLLASLGPESSWDHTVKVALSSLRLTHQMAHLRCTQAVEQLAERLADLQANKDGWLAYAANSEWSEPTP